MKQLMIAGLPAGADTFNRINIVGSSASGDDSNCEEALADMRTLLQTGAAQL